MLSSARAESKGQVCPRCGCTEIELDIPTCDTICTKCGACISDQFYYASTQQKSKTAEKGFESQGFIIKKTNDPLSFNSWKLQGQSAPSITGLRSTHIQRYLQKTKERIETIAAELDFDINDERMAATIAKAVKMLIYFSYSDMNIICISSTDGIFALKRE